MVTDGKKPEVEKEVKRDLLPSVTPEFRTQRIKRDGLS